MKLEYLEAVKAAKVPLARDDVNWRIVSKKTHTHMFFDGEYIEDCKYGSANVQ